MNTHARITAVVLATAALLVALLPIRAAERGISPCTISSGPTKLTGITEASGLTLSRKSSDLLWSHNDSGAPIVFALGLTGVKGRVALPRATVTDWEDISAGPCPSGECLYLADIGDNKRVRRTVTIYRVAEPSPTASQTSAPEVFTAAYPDGPHDAEAAFVVESGLFIITKDNAGALYRLPQPLQSKGTTTLQRVGTLGLPRVTDADASPDGRLVAVRTNNDLVVYRTADLVSGDSHPRDASISLRSLHEPQGEGVALGPEGEVYLASEGAGRAGSLTSLHCTLR